MHLHAGAAAAVVKGVCALSLSRQCCGPPGEYIDAVSKDQNAPARAPI